MPRYKAKVFNKIQVLILIGFLILLTIYSCTQETTRNSNISIANNHNVNGVISGELKQWHKITITFDGLNTSENSNPNPFRDYRLNVTFSHGNHIYTVPGYYAADGNAAETSADTGNKWQVNFMPDEVGEWNYVASFRQGRWIAVNDNLEAGKAIAFDGAKGSFIVTETDKNNPDFRSRGLLNYVGKHYLQFKGTGEYFLKGGANSPENFLAYYEFDNTQTDKHKYQPHERDWKPGDSLWQENKGKNIIGALNYLSSKGMNVVYFLTMNVKGDGDDVFPWISKNQRDRFDCSKLAQWEIVFSHMDKLGLMLHVVTQETENDQLLNWGRLGNLRQLYYRELIARFAHHPALIWNLGEENTNTTKQLKEFANYFHNHDPYNHPLVVHTYPSEQEKVYQPLLGDENFTGASLQMKKVNKTHTQTQKWIDESGKVGHKWFVGADEFGPAQVGVKPDKNDYWHDDVRKEGLWGNLMANGSGSEWYFGYKFPHNDLNCEDWRSRDHMWDLTRYALEFFHNYLPFWEMTDNDELVSNPDAYALAKIGEIYAIYLKNGGSTELEIPTGTYTIKWYNPRQGGKLENGSVNSITGSGLKSIGNPPSDNDKDWTVLIERNKNQNSQAETKKDLP
ncbi:MAG: DUF5060 domain-containing protein [Okeania sp. SIO3I5]|uniref:DUF5060 domain-containing protein n=1 Tax=Okeania sp. SIO3I5 TaxID=2607805 RepID=UPI0013B5E35A|nr:DUF5060 domain-containing protein [Okeania sp. SIO3I5]NEQ40036.1 DUF5060 domain-containing protein [Okeania sp. SIO3I5]